MDRYKVTAHKQLKNNLATLIFNVKAESTERAREAALFELDRGCQIFSIEYIVGSKFEVRAVCSNYYGIGESKVITVEADTYDEARGIASSRLLDGYDNVVLIQVKEI